jgi:hypothetical protein
MALAKTMAAVLELASKSESMVGSALLDPATLHMLAQPSQIQEPSKSQLRRCLTLSS